MGIVTSWSWGHLDLDLVGFVVLVDHGKLL